MKDYDLLFPIENSIEKLSLTPISKNYYRMEETALSEEGVFYRDIIEAKVGTDKELSFLRVVERSGLRVFRFLLPKQLVESEPWEAFLKRVEAHGGFWEQIFGGILLIHLPRGSACRPKSEIRAMLAMLHETG